MKDKNIIFRVSRDELEKINAIKMRVSIYNTSELILCLFDMAFDMLKQGEANKLITTLNIYRRHKFIDK